MLPHHFFIIGSISLLVGVLLAGHLPIWSLLLAVAAVGGTVFVTPGTSSIKLVTLVMGACLIVGGIRFQAHLADFRHRQSQISIGSEAKFTGIIDDTVEYSQSRARTTVIITSLNQSATTLRVRSTIWGQTGLTVGQRLSGNIRFEPPPEHPGFLLQDNIHGLATIYQVESSSPAHFHIRHSLINLRDYLSARIKTFVDDPEGNLINGILLGIRSDLPDDLQEDLRRSATTHIVALSGFNITLVIILILAMVKRLPRRIGLLLAAGAILLFIIMTGLSSSVVRAACMGWLFLLGSLWGRHTHMGSVLALSAASMVLVYPFILQYDIGFQLSVLAMAGLIFLTPLINPWVSKLRPLVLQEVVTSTLAASLATVPLVAFYFGGISVVGLAANLTIVPLIPFAMATSFLGLFASLLQPWSYPLSWIAWAPAHLIVLLVEFWGGLPGAYIKVNTLSPIWPAAIYSGMIVIIYYHAFISSLHSRASDSRGSLAGQPLHLSSGRQS